MNLYSWLQLIFYLVVLLALAKPLGLVHGPGLSRASGPSSTRCCGPSSD